jgi:hypothetical protein
VPQAKMPLFQNTKKEHFEKGKTKNFFFIKNENLKHNSFLVIKK